MAESPNIAPSSEVLKELQAKRRALLESISCRKQERDQKIIQKHTQQEVTSAIYELTRLGYDFKRLLAESGVNKSFLKKQYELLNMPVTDNDHYDPIEKESSASAGDHHGELPRKRQHTNNETCAGPSYEIETNGVSLSNVELNVIDVGEASTKIARIQGKPDWLKNLVIQIESSDEEDAVQTDTSTIVPTQEQPLTPHLNLNAEMSRILMRLKIEILRLKRRAANTDDDSKLSASMVEILLAKKQDVCDDLDAFLKEFSRQDE
ncbi:LAMI_0E00606g1_1 [Lachancea mirantina]|uniref:LAMI_0E00606g1_1 n=1 Tax=Lachancea mirantina TaxID=1230905 RepID=A0A1G4JIC3_9SACH|nr:LAMI_0E00606g1_1 [Lachancea mirantina]